MGASTIGLCPNGIPQMAAVWIFVKHFSGWQHYHRDARRCPSHVAPLIPDSTEET